MSGQAKRQRDSSNDSKVGSSERQFTRQGPPRKKRRRTRPKKRRGAFVPNNDTSDVPPRLDAEHGKKFNNPFISGQSNRSQSPRPSSSQITAAISTSETAIQKMNDLLRTLQQNLTCQICLDLLSKPYLLVPCGHTACQSCLIKWFSSGLQDPSLPHDQDLMRLRKSCPQCRASVRQRPVSIWVVKNLLANLSSSGFIDSKYHLEASLPPLHSDPWNGIFQPTPLTDYHDVGMHDPEDDVFRCIDCLHEIRYGECSNCQRRYPEESVQLENMDSVDEANSISSSDDTSSDLEDFIVSDISDVEEHVSEDVDLSDNEQTSRSNNFCRRPSRVSVILSDEDSDSDLNDSTQSQD